MYQTTAVFHHVRERIKSSTLLCIKMGEHADCEIIKIQHYFYSAANASRHCGVNILDILHDTMPEVIAPFPKLLALKARVAATERIAKYLKERPETAF